MIDMSKIKPYDRSVYYYETDRMQIVHHSNYIRWIEEARLDWMKQIGWDYKSIAVSYTHLTLPTNSLV